MVRTSRAGGLRRTVKIGLRNAGAACPGPRRFFLSSTSSSSFTIHRLSSGQDLQPIIQRARDGDSQAIELILAWYRDYLRAVAVRRMAQPLQRRMDPSDLVQQTLLEAQHDLDGLFRSDEAHLRAGLRQILTCNVSNAIRDHLRTEKRAMSREQRLDGADAIQSLTTPSMRCVRHETTERFLQELDSLPEDQATAVRMRYFESASVSEIGKALHRSRAAAAGLLKRGLSTLRTKLGGETAEWI